MDEYYLWSGRLQGWFTGGGTYSTDLSEARTFNHDDAIVMCKRHKSHAGYQLLPVRVQDLGAVG